MHSFFVIVCLWKPVSKHINQKVSETSAIYNLYNLLYIKPLQKCYYANYESVLTDFSVDLSMNLLIPVYVNLPVLHPSHRTWKGQILWGRRSAVSPSNFPPKSNLLLKLVDIWYWTRTERFKRSKAITSFKTSDSFVDKQLHNTKYFGHDNVYWSIRIIVKLYFHAVL